MIAGLNDARSCLPPSLAKSQIPSTFKLDVPRDSASIVYPTHILALAGNSRSSDAILVPVHAIVLASHCSAVPPIPVKGGGRAGHGLHLPVLPLTLPAPASFSLLQKYMYTHRLDTVLDRLLPVPKSFTDALSHEIVMGSLRSGTTLHGLSTHVCNFADGNGDTLMTMATGIRDLYQNMVALGVQDTELWDTVDLAYEVVVGAFRLAGIPIH
jgi:hypothetical protein